jgi:hypothetical protein
MGIKRNLQLVGLFVGTLICGVTSENPAFAAPLTPYEKGLHLRPGLGVGASGSAASSDFVPSAGQDLDGVLRGVTLVGELFVEKVVAHRVLLGGVVYAQVMLAPQLDEVDWAEQDGGDIAFDGTGMLMAGATASVHFDDGGYITGSAGPIYWNTLRGEAEEGDVRVPGHSGLGFGILPGIGYEYLGAERSFGVLLQFLMGSVYAWDGNGTAWNYLPFMPSIAVTMAIH